MQLKNWIDLNFIKINKNKIIKNLIKNHYLLKKILKKSKKTQIFDFF